MGLVQSKSGTGTGTSLTVTLTSATGSGNCLIVGAVCSGTSSNGSVSGVTLGGAAGNFAQAATIGGSGDGGIAAFWVDPSCAGGQTSVVVSVTGGTGTQTIFVWADERDDIAAAAPVDKTAGAVAASGTSWSSGATATTSQASEVWYGIVFGIGATGPTITGPASPWVNHTQVNAAVGTSNGAMTTGYDVVASTGACTYNGTFDLSSEWAAAAMTLTAAAAGPGAAFVPYPWLQMRTEQIAGGAGGRIIRS